MNKYQSLASINLEDTNRTYGAIKPVTPNYNSDAEKFFPQFYKLVAEIDCLFQSLSNESSLILGFELVNRILSHLSGALLKNDLIKSEIDSHKFTAISSRLSNYVF